MKIYKILTTIVVSFILTTIVACSSVKKTKIQEKETIKSNQVETSSKAIEETSKVEKINSTNTNIQKDNLSIEYLPEFDSSGKLVPFSFNKKDNNGNETNVNITGNAKVKYFTEKQVSNIVESTKEETSKKITELENKVSKLESIVNKLSKQKQVYPDYVKYMVWILAGLLVLTGSIFVLYLYIKSKLKLIPKWPI